ncbi:spore coat protein [Halalkalibacter akibai]|uniref:Spore coat protein n=1 Tax=Halalkalibacter akibai (strain ATCC 43226 / DSM 21942 / CIP 109018 / JCM 9157 / 1139) TaxID=1236973 RepID=W4QZQ4_HALA3|nr:spore coat protein [Halalkalibacter akibai]GAE37148.1 spore coat protein [Halalkalibacter akibai JCM 9157]
MTNIIQNIAGLSAMTDQVIATDFLITAKSGVRNMAFALTEAATPELRVTLRQQLNDAIETHEKISQYMIDKGYYYPSDLDEQAKVDLTASKVALKISK